MRVVRVTDVTGLLSATADARPGDLILLADGAYPIHEITLSRSGTPDRPIILCGSRGAVLSGGYLRPNDVRYWTIRGLRVTGGLWGIYAQRSSFLLIDSVEVDHTDQEAVHIQTFSTHNTVMNSHIHDTGIARPVVGEGVYIGSDNAKWCEWTTACAPDKSDSNVVIGNLIERTGAENVDVKAGTTGTLIQSNVLASPGLSRSIGSDAWVALRGDGATVSDNVATDASRVGFQVWPDVPPWGRGNAFRRNSASLQPTAYLGFQIRPGFEQSNLVSCDNVVMGAPLANVECE
jgi:hypothetical protein